MPTRILNAGDIRSIVQHVGIHTIMDEIINRLEQTLQKYNSAACEIPPRAGFAYDQPYPGLIEWMPLISHGDSVTIKIVGYHPENPNVNDLPTILSTTCTYDVKSGQLLGFVDSTFLTALRTGAASAVASRYLASSNSRTIGLIGAGAQALTQLHALSRIFSLDRVLVYDVEVGTCQNFAQRAQFLNLKIETAPTAEILEEVDILVTATQIAVGEGPVFNDTPHKEWLHINAVGSDFSGKTELPLELLQRGTVCPDFADQAMKEGECQQLSRDTLGPSLIALAQHPEEFVHLKNQLTVFDSTGWALEDQVAMEMVMDYANDLQIGQIIDLDGGSDFPKDPYHFYHQTLT